MNIYLPEITVKSGDSRRIIDLIDRINVNIHGLGPDAELIIKLILQYDYVKKLIEELR